MEVRGDFLLERQDVLAAVLAEVKGRTLSQATAILRQSALPWDLSNALMQLLGEGWQRHQGAAR
jgi:hypothetical protein